MISSPTTSTSAQLEVTYRPLTFLDDKSGGYSAQVSNALFLAAERAGYADEATGTEFQRFVEELWVNQDPGGTAHRRRTGGHGNESRHARAASPRTSRGGKSAVDTEDMDDSNFEFLYEIDSVDTGTPTVYDLDKGEKLDIYDNDWLDKLMQS